MLPELVEHGITGLVVKDTPAELASATLRLLRHPELRTEMGKAAYQKAHREFRIDSQVVAIEGFYQEMITLGKWKK
jgi:glycosyltransferase involved in cell wall biosynthesis